jgi:hypothetical protein
LRKADEKTGRQLHKDVLALSSHSGRHQPIELTLCNSAEDLFAELEVVLNEARAGARHILHIECHGASSGLEMTNGDFVPWEDLLPRLRAINYASRFNLTLALSACFGATFASTTRLDEPSAVRAILGPTDDTTDVELARAFRVFYGNVLVAADGERAVRSFLKAEKKYPYYLGLAENLFRDGFSLVAAEFNGALLVARARRIADQMKEKSSRADLLSIAIGMIESLKPRFDESYRRYFMIDDLPENTTRFPVSFEDCVARGRRLGHASSNPQ